VTQSWIEQSLNSSFLTHHSSFIIFPYKLAASGWNQNFTFMKDYLSPDQGRNHSTLKWEIQIEFINIPGLAQHLLIPEGRGRAGIVKTNIRVSAGLERPFTRGEAEQAGRLTADQPHNLLQGEALISQGRGHQNR
jgi:hypothetical protein